MYKDLKEKFAFTLGATHVGIFNNTRRVGFTLAEVLITLGIIGIVSAMTIPTLINNYQKKVTVTRLQQTYSMLNQAFKMAQVEHGDPITWNYPKERSYEASKDFAKKYLTPYLKINKICGEQTADCIQRDTKYLNGATYGGQNTTSYYRFILANGVLVSLAKYSADDSILFGVDINASAGPNTMGKDIFEMLYVTSLPYDHSFFGRNINQLGLYMLGHGRTRESLLTEKYPCSKAPDVVNAGQHCGALIQLDGWKISDDYPW